jgi:predicted amidophosphoribosyltransferase
LIARRLESSHGAIVLRILNRRAGPAQKGLDFAARRENLRGRIGPAGRTGKRPPPPEVVVIDDVFTTGATADACARVLRGMGSRTVSVVTLATD